MEVARQMDKDVVLVQVLTEHLRRQDSLLTMVAVLEHLLRSCIFGHPAVAGDPGREKSAGGDSGSTRDE